MDTNPQSPWHTVTPYLAVDGAAELIGFLEAVFDAQVKERIPGEAGKLMHSEIQIGDSMIMLADASDRCPATTVALYVYVPDVDATYQKGLAAGATSESEPKDQFYGDRSGGVIDKWGNRWWIATHKEDVSEEEMKRRTEEWKQKSQQA
jgi:PhnB protein